MPSDTLEPWRADFYRETMKALDEERIPFMVGGAYAFEQYTGIARDTCDFDIFVAREAVPEVFAAVESRGWRKELTFPHWLGKVYRDGAYVDVIFGAGNGVAMVDGEWRAHAERGRVLGRDALLIPAEEMIWSKAFIMERERFDGNDVMHVLRARGDRLDWDRLLRRFGRHWRVLFAHLVLFGFVYPAERGRIPARVLRALAGRLAADEDGAEPGLCRGTLISREQYLPDLRLWGYRDARLELDVQMDEADIARWTAAIDEAADG
ncbi:MAG TPA: hypothetical protein VII13_09475 [Vicinamibacteria bacterium]|jgi:hypothetical protein